MKLSTTIHDFAKAVAATVLLTASGSPTRAGQKPNIIQGMEVFASGFAFVRSVEQAIVELKLHGKICARETSREPPDCDSRGAALRGAPQPKGAVPK